MKIIIVVLCCVFVTNGQGANLNFRLIGDIRPPNAPNYAALFFNAHLKHFCSGTLIHPTWVVTSATCAKKVYNEERRVSFGGNIKPNFNNASYIKNVYIHPSFSPNLLSNDIALVELVSPAAPTNRIIKITKDFKIPSGTKAYALGYGNNGLEDNANGVLRQHRVNILDNKICEIFPVNINFNKLCSYQSRACEGDQGGPLISEVSGELIGLISINDDQAAMCGGFIISPVTTYTSVYYYRHWITVTTGIFYL